jgi:hypothetical protein
MYISDGRSTIIVLTAYHNSRKTDLLALTKLIGSFEPVTQGAAFYSLFHAPHSLALAAALEYPDQFDPFFFFAHLLSLLCWLINLILS